MSVESVDEVVTYRSLLARPSVASLLASVAVGRVASGVVPFGIVAYYSQLGRYGEAGVASAAFMIVSALLGPAKGRLVTVKSPQRTLLPMAVTFAMAGIASIVSSQAGAPFVVPLALFAVAAALAPPNSSVVRSTWTAISDGPAMKKSLHALDSVLEELTFVVSPLITSAVWVVAGAQWAVPMGSIFAVVGTASLVFVGVRSEKTRPVFAARDTDEAEPAGEKLSFRQVYLHRGTVGLLSPMFALGLAMGGLSIVLPAWSGHYYGSPALSGVLLAVVSAGGVLSGVVFGRSTVDRVSDIGQYVASAFIVGVGVIGFVVLPTIIGSVVSALLVGIGMTPMFILAYVLVDKVVPSRYHTEVNAALGSGYNLGDGVATVALGFVIAAAGTNNALLAVAVVVIALSCLGLLLKAPATSE